MSIDGDGWKRSLNWQQLVIIAIALAVAWTLGAGQMAWHLLTQCDCPATVEEDG